MAIDWPACPSVIAKSRAIGLNRLTGMNSDDISIVAHSAIAITAPQAGAVAILPDAGMVYLVVLG